MQDKTYAIKLEGVRAGYEGSPVTGSIDLALEQGEILTLIGPNGGGKSTLLKTIAGQLAEIAGVIYLSGTDLKEIDPRKKARHMASVWTGSRNALHMTCREVVAMGRYPYTGRLGLLKEEDEKTVEEAMQLADVAALADKEYGHISDGQRQRVLLARAFCQEPEVLILDEPTTYLDVRYKLEFISGLKRMQQQKDMTVILSLHELGLAGYISDRILCLDGEKTVKVVSAQDLFEDDTIRELFGLSDEQYEKARKMGFLPQ